MIEVFELLGGADAVADGRGSMNLVRRVVVWGGGAAGSFSMGRAWTIGGGKGRFDF